MSAVNDLSSPPCAACAAIPGAAFAYLDRNDELPPAVYRLRHLGTHFRQCPQCRMYYYYDYWPPGPGNIGDREDIDRLTPEQAACLRPILETTDAIHLAADLARALVSEQERIRKWTQDAYEYLLAQLGFPALLPALAELLAHPDAAVRQFVHAALAEQVNDHDLTPVAAALQTALTDTDLIALRAAETLASHCLRERRIAALQALLRHKRSQIRLGALYGLKTAAYRQTVPAEIVADLTRRLSDRVAAIRSQAAYVLGDLAAYCDISGAAAKLGQALLDTGSVRYWALKALDNAAWRKLDMRAALPFFTRVLSERSEAERIEAARVMQRMAVYDITPALPALIENVRSSDILLSTLRGAVASALIGFAEQHQANAQLIRKLFRQAKVTKSLNREIRDIYKKLNAVKRRAS